MDFPLFDAIVLGNKNAVMNILNLSGPNGSGYLSGPNEMMNNNRNGNILRTMKDDMGRTPLHWAASNQYSEKLVPLLIELGASIHSTDCLGFNPLHVHCARGRVYGVAALLFHGADVNCKAPLRSEDESEPSSFVSPIEIAIKHNHVEIIRILLAYGAIAPATSQTDFVNDDSTEVFKEDS